MSRAAVKASKAKRDAAKIDRWQARIEHEASLKQIALICDSCHMAVVIDPFAKCCNCGGEYGTFYAYPTTSLAEYLSVN